MSDNEQEQAEIPEGENGEPIEPVEPEEPRNFLKKEDVVAGLSLIQRTAGKSWSTHISQTANHTLTAP